MSGQGLLRTLHRGAALPSVPAVPLEWCGPDRRSSLRVALGDGLPAMLVGIGPCRLREVSLGGAMLQVEQRLRGDERYLLRVDYQGLQASLPIRVYENSLYELFYDTDTHSRVSFHTRVICCDAPIEGLNLLYRIMRDHWSPLSAPA